MWLEQLLLLLTRTLLLMLAKLPCLSLDQYTHRSKQEMYEFWSAYHSFLSKETAANRNYPRAVHHQVHTELQSRHVDGFYVLSRGTQMLPLPDFENNEP
ncbi:hypothetical protein SADUNF_Sadunf13G0027000 [Salix dunnii]|uniref:Uncharacterized protein n=1 Tax=Salix dunnii TaxID=1413687 RepID=A0A835MN29_9ROSI|nr:hypothetical protein SADUNF_Sadunf13G0027000 [Salix dunnii]